MGNQETLSVPRPVVFTVRLPRSLHGRFKKMCVELGNLDMTVVVRTMIRLFLDDEEFKQRILEELRTREG